mmetsp:Transcript_113096/g.365317  ORF Transcript_113096/g.365317 Transcript_113096/m.365317 type:complete len:222 (-) Transcript_113096:1842-2507(-)
MKPGDFFRPVQRTPRKAWASHTKVTSVEPVSSDGPREEHALFCGAGYRGSHPPPMARTSRCSPARLQQRPVAARPLRTEPAQGGGTARRARAAAGRRASPQRPPAWRLAHCSVDRLLNSPPRCSRTRTGSSSPTRATGSRLLPAQLLDATLHGLSRFGPAPCQVRPVHLSAPGHLPWPSPRRPSRGSLALLPWKRVEHLVLSHPSTAWNAQLWRPPIQKRA